MTCQICNTALTATGCPRCNQRREIGLVQARCNDCNELFTYDADFAPQVACDGCTGKRMKATIAITRRFYPVGVTV